MENARKTAGKERSCRCHKRGESMVFTSAVGEDYWIVRSQGWKCALKSSHLSGP